MATKNFIEELEWRGMIHTIMPGAKEQLEKELTTAYLGIDPPRHSSSSMKFFVAIIALFNFHFVFRWKRSSESASV